MGEKSPAFQFYPKDFMSGTATMTLEERGAYMTLLCYQWDNEAIPGESKAIARILGVPESRGRKLWATVCPKFSERDGAHRNQRLETEREKQLHRRAALAANGAQGGRPPKAKPNQEGTNRLSVAKANGNQNESLTSSSSSSFASSEKNNNRPIIRGEAAPGGYGKIHSAHVIGFCDWCCLPEFVFDEFRRKSGEPAKLPDGGEAYVRGWALKVREEWHGAIGDSLKFWRARWDDSHPEIPQQVLDPAAVAKAAYERQKAARAERTK